MPPYRGTSTFVVPQGVVLRKSTAAGRIHATRWEVYEGDKAPKIMDIEDEDKRYLGDVVRWSEAGWSWQPAGGGSREFQSVGPIADVLSELAKEIRGRQGKCPKCGMDKVGLAQELIELHERNCS